MGGIEIHKRVRACIAECVGTLVFVFFGTMSVVAAASSGNQGDASTLTIATGFGIGLAIAIYIAQPVSGGHLNPAVTIALATTGNISMADCIFYVISQLVGSIAGSAVGYGVAGGDKYAGAVGVGPGFVQGQAFIAELFGTFVLVMIVFNVAVQTTVGLQTPSKLSVRSLAPFIIGLSLWVIEITIVQVSGGAVNPARALGPAVILNDFSDHWVFWAGPGIGLMVAVAMQILFHGDVRGDIVNDEDEVMMNRKITDARVVV